MKTRNACKGQLREGMLRKRGLIPNTLAAKRTAVSRAGTLPTSQSGGDAAKTDLQFQTALRQDREVRQTRLALRRAELILWQKMHFIRYFKQSRQSGQQH